MMRAGSLIIAVAVLALSNVAAAAPTGGGCPRVPPIIGFLDDLLDITPDCGTSSGPPGSVQAPEIDPAAAIGAATLLLGGLAVLRGRKTRV